MVKKRVRVLKPLKPIKQKPYKFIGFDVETIGKDNIFYMGGLYSDDGYISFYNKDEMIKHMLQLCYSSKHKIRFVATNLSFDFTVLFYDHKTWNDFNILYRQSNIIYAKYPINTKHVIHFTDTMNYAPYMSVEKLGKIINIHKLDKPACLGRLPKNKKEKLELQRYNKYDCMISKKFMDFFQSSIISLKGKLKITIASTSFDIWQRSYLKQPLEKEWYVLNDPSIRDFIFSGYYGGRAEVFQKTTDTHIYYYDINSLYPSVMRDNDFPLPQSCYVPDTYNERFINKYEGVTECTVWCPSMHKPLLPFRFKGKLLFPIGTFRGTWNHCELREALKVGYKIIKIFKQLLYTETFRPFTAFVDDFYGMRKQYKKEKNPMQLAVKLIMNSLYGKFSMKRVQHTKIFDITDFTEEDFNEHLPGVWDMSNDNTAIKQEEIPYDGKTCFPIIASYCTSYARLKMYPYLNKGTVLYTDTDSIMVTEQLYDDSLELGEMKLENIYSNGYIARPKCYYMKNDSQTVVKMKGVPKPSIDDFESMQKGLPIKKQKFVRLRESIRRGLSVNEIITITKRLSLHDDKRVWNKNISKPKKLIVL